MAIFGCYTDHLCLVYFSHSQCVVHYVQVGTVPLDYINTSLNGYIWFQLFLVYLTHALYFSFTHLSSVMFKHYLLSIHFQQYQFELQYLMAVKPAVGNIAFHFISALTACWNQHIQAIIWRWCCLPLLYLFDVKVAVLIMPFHYLCRTTTGVATIFRRG